MSFADAFNLTWQGIDPQQILATLKDAERRALLELLPIIQDKNERVSYVGDIIDHASWF